MDTQLSPQAKNLVGKKFGRLTVISFAGKNGRLTWNCNCDCGKSLVVFGDNLKSGHSRSCGCLKTDGRNGKWKKVGYESYRQAKRRCENPNCKAFGRYGGRGIEFRFTSFEQFIECIGEKPSSSHTVDRIDPDGHYEPGNVRWATSKQQADNKRNTIRITIDGVTKTLTEWCDGSTQKRIKCYRRLANGWCPICALDTPSRAAKPTCTHEWKD